MEFKVEKISYIIRQYRHLAAVAGITLIWAMIYLPSLSVPDVTHNESRRILPAITMVNTGNWAVPMLGGRPYFRKPPMMSWIIAAFYKLTGRHGILISRLPTTIFILCFAVILVFMPSGILDLEARVISSCIFLTTFGMILQGRTANIDPVYVCFTGFATILWLHGWSKNTSRWWRWLPAIIPLAVGMLLKGPLILFFFYTIVAVLLFLTSEKREILSLPSIITFAFSLIPFCVWSYYAKHGLLKAGSHPHFSSIWLHEITYRFSLGRIGVAKWGRRVMGGIFQFLPWLPFLAWIKNISTGTTVGKKRQIFIKGAWITMLVCFVAISLVPLTKARYTLPLLPIFALTVAMLICYSPKRLNFSRLLERITHPFISFLAVLGLVLLGASFASRIFLEADQVSQHARLKMILHTLASLPSYQTMTAALLVLVFLFLYKKGLFPSSSSFCSLIALIISITLSLHLFFVFLLPTALTFKHPARITALAIDSFVENSSPVYAVGVGEPAFLAHLKHEWQVAIRFSSLKTLPEYLMIGKNSYKKLLKNVKNVKLRIVKCRKIKYKSHEYFLIKIEQSK